MKNNFNGLIKIKNLLGILFIILGLVCNEWIFEKFASIYAVIEFNKRFPVWLLEVCLIFAGIVLLLTVINKNSIKSFFKKILLNSYSGIIAKIKTPVNDGKGVIFRYNSER